MKIQKNGMRLMKRGCNLLELWHKKMKGKQQATMGRNYIDNMWLNFSHQAVIKILALKLEDWRWLINFYRETDNLNAWNWNPQLSHQERVSLIFPVDILNKSEICHLVKWMLTHESLLEICTVTLYFIITKLIIAGANLNIFYNLLLMEKSCVKIQNINTINRPINKD